MTMMMKRLLWLLLLIAALSVSPLWAQNGQNGQNVPTTGSSASGAPSGPAGGELTGTFPNPSLLRNLIVGEGAPFLLSATGTFTTGTNFEYLESSLNTCSPSTAITKTNTINAYGSAATYTDGLSGCISIPAGTGLVTNGLNNAVSGYVINNNSSNQGKYGGGTVFANAVQGTSYCKAGPAECEGIVVITQDDASLSNITLVGVESGILPQNIGDIVYAFLASPFGTVQPTGDSEIAFYAHSDAGAPSAGNNTNQFDTGFECGTAAIFVQNSFYAPCIRIQPKSALSFSQTIEFNSGNPNTPTELLQTNDAANAPFYRLNVPGSAGAATIPILPDHANTDSIS